MAGFVGTRTQPGLLGPRGGSAQRTTTRRSDRTAGEEGRAPALPRRSVRGAVAVRSQRRQARVGYIVVGIAAAFLLGLFSLSQTVRVSAIDYDLGALSDARAQLVATERELRGDLARLGSEPAVRARAVELGLLTLVEPVVVPAH